MATVKSKWRPSIVEGKAGTVYYQVIHDRVVRRVKTECKVFADEWSDACGIVVPARVAHERDAMLVSMQERIAWDLKRMNAIIERFDERGLQYTADDIVVAFTGQPQGQSFFGFMQHVIAQLSQLNKCRTAENYAMTLSSFSRFRAQGDLLLSEVDSTLMTRYEAYLVARGVSKNTISFYMRILRAVYNRAVEQELTTQRNPFKHVYTGVDKTVKRAIPFAVIKRIKELDLSLQPALDFARDMFLFSFYTRGMSFIDMAYLRKRDLRYGVVVYRRRKTGQQLTIKWEPCMQGIVAKYQQRNVCPADCPYLLPILCGPEGSRNRYRNVLQQINKSLKTIAKLVNLDVPLTMYVARHSWASIARWKNIPLSVISEGMGHDSEATTQIYLASLDTAVVDRANRLILKDLL